MGQLDLLLLDLDVRIWHEPSHAHRLLRRSVRQLWRAGDDRGRFRFEHKLVATWGSLNNLRIWSHNVHMLAVRARSFLNRPSCDDSDALLRSTWAWFDLRVDQGGSSDGSCNALAASKLVLEVL